MNNPTAYLRSSYLNDPDAIRDFMERHVVFRVKFRKKDGTIRHLLGTVEPKFLGVNTLGTEELSLVNVGTSEPKPENAQYPWLRLEDKGNPLGWYFY